MIEQFIYGRLKDDVAVEAIVSARIYPLAIPQNSTYPCVSYEVSRDDEEESFDGQGTFKRSTIDISAWSETYDDMRDLAEAIKSALKNYTGTHSGVVIDKVFIESSVAVYEQEIEKYRETMLITLFSR